MRTRLQLHVVGLTLFDIENKIKAKVGEFLGEEDLDEAMTKVDVEVEVNNATTSSSFGEGDTIDTESHYEAIAYVKVKA
jgi:hypothetical protein